ncbi:MAG: hypothetical protein ACRCZZ_03960, partial [Phocaeicola sp.]
MMKKKNVRSYSFYSYLLAKTLIIGSFLTIISCSADRHLDINSDFNISGITGSQDIKIEFIDSISSYDYYNLILKGAQGGTSAEDREAVAFATTMLEKLNHYADSLSRMIDKDLLRARIGEDGEGGKNRAIGY